MGFKLKASVQTAYRAGTRLAVLLRADPLSREAIAQALAAALEKYHVLAERWDRISERDGREITAEASRVHQELGRFTLDTLCAEGEEGVDAREDALNLVGDFQRRANTLFPPK